MAFMATLRGGRKAVIFVSEGVPVDAWQVVNARPARFGGLFSDIDTDFIEALSFATRNNIALYPIDPRGLTTGVTGEEVDSVFDQTRRADTQATLENRLDMGGLAAVTGGFALSGSNNYTAAFERLIRENSTHYLLGFNSGVEQRDGRYVNLEVRVKRPGLQVRSIDGYAAPHGRPREPRRPPASAVLAATWDAVASAITTSGVPIRVYAAPFRSKGKDKAATVAITVEGRPDP
jgi:VWFA-related protein